LAQGKIGRHAHLASAQPKHLAWGSNSFTIAGEMLRLRGRQMSMTVVLQA
jgi:hypothetical protein